jgi:hypothetical protein
MVPTKFGVKQANVRPPKGWTIISRTSRAFCAGGIVLFHGTSYVPDKVSEPITFMMAVLLLVFQSFDVGLGYHPDNGIKN